MVIVCDPGAAVARVKIGRASWLAKAVFCVGAAAETATGAATASSRI
jgi:hypothetical protein